MAGTYPVKNGTTITKDTVKRVLTEIKALPDHEVLVGIPEEKTERGSEMITNAAIGYLHDTGSPEANIPARPFLAVGVRDAVTGIARYFKQAAIAAGKGNTLLVDKLLHVIGQLASDAVKARITRGPFTPLAPATIAARLRRGRTGSRPLIDTGQLRRAITYVVRHAKP